MKRPHIVPLVQVRFAPCSKNFEAIPPSSSPVPANLDKPISNNAMLYALYRAGYHSKMTLARLPGLLLNHLPMKSAKRNRMPLDLR